jgi:hypothetical protein
MLDHLVVSPVLRAACRDVTVFNDGLADETTADAPPAGSFHAPLAASFELP